jgi:signal transduction histidine kinase
MPPVSIIIPLETSAGELRAEPNAETIIRNLAHELRQPLSALESIAFYLDLMLNQEDPKMRKQLRRLRQLVQQSDWAVSNAVLTAGVSPLTFSAVNLADLVADCATNWAAEHSLQLGLVRPDQFRVQLLDEDQIRLLMRNILSFIRRGSYASIVVSASETDAEVMVEAEEMQIPDSESLALMAIEKIVTQHRGSVAIEEGPEDAKRIRVRLPFRF